MATLPAKPTLNDFQQYVREVVHERGFENETIEQLFMLFLEEGGELAKAARKHVPIKSDINAKNKHRVDYEAADVLMYLLEICNRFDIDLERAFRDKEELNKTRTWK